MPRMRPSPVIPHLLREQANAVELYLQYKGYHWNVAGPLFRELHLLFDEHAGTVFEMIDAFAERQRMLGAAAPYTLESLHRAATVPHEPGLPASTREMLERLISAHHVVIDGMHEGFRVAEHEGDPGSADMFARYVQAHEKMEWFLRELASEPPQLPEEPGRASMVGEKGGLASAMPASHPPTAYPGHPLTS
jgi:starvation-inducible DNA-binding protein